MANWKTKTNYCTFTPGFGEFLEDDEDDKIKYENGDDP
jgi:hypothetical protein